MPLYAGIEVDARNAANVLSAFRLIPRIAYRTLSKHGLGEVNPQGKFAADPRLWWPLDRYLAALFEISDAVGPRKMQEIGKFVPKHAALPPTLRDIHSTFESLDQAYHLNHRKQREVMLDLASGRMLEGIGHYWYKAHPGERRITISCENPYPCDVDRGILTGFALRFEASAVVEHETPTRCRKNGAESCGFVVTW
jgi:hypothetical protein